MAEDTYLLCLIEHGTQNECSTKMMSVSSAETLFSGSHMKQAPRANLLLKLRGYLAMFAH
jgi:hypothetical protein